VITPGQSIATTTTSGAASLSERILQLQAEARSLAADHIQALRAQLLQTQRIADEIARGGEAYPAGVRDIARRLSEDSVAKALTIEGIVARL
jgi:hypothetical protein